MNRRGAVLLEAILALAILGTVSIALLQLAGQTVATVEVATRAERELREADRFLRAVTLWSRRELDQRLGSRRQGEWLLSIQRPAADLYTIALTDSLGRDTLLASALYRARRPS